jgi:hypothetical protein
MRGNKVAYDVSIKCTKRIPELCSYYDTNKAAYDGSLKCTKRIPDSFADQESHAWADKSPNRFAITCAEWLSLNAPVGFALDASLFCTYNYITDCCPISFTIRFTEPGSICEPNGLAFRFA